MSENGPLDERQSTVLADGGGTDDLLDLLSHRDRRAVLSVLMANGEKPTPFEKLTETVSRERPDGADRRTVATDLHHVHLPKLAAAGVVTYDAPRSTVTYTGGERVESLFEAIDRVDGD